MPRDDIDTRHILWAGAAIAGSVAIVVIAVLLLLRLWHTPAGADRARLGYDLFVDGPALQSAPQPDLARYRAEKAKILATSDWVDAPHGIVRIPIDAAMRLLVEQGGAASVPNAAVAEGGSVARRLDAAASAGSAVAKGAP
ncbi:MAG: hypothetical protein ACJ8G7_17420 [Rhizobacter sp.]